METKIVAYYLPQFHPFPENDEWWGKGFTEWTNVGKAKPLFHRHDQPKVPADLGYYDLRLPEIREQQVNLAREAGIYGFCYWHYWFGGEGRQLMNRIIDEVATSGKPDFPFCLGWANESWKAKQWNKDGLGDVLLMEQKYEGEVDYRLHFNYVKKLFKDPRYVRVNGCPFFLIYKPFDSPQVENLIAFWNKWIHEEQIAEKVYFVASLDKENQKEKCIEMGFDAVTPAHLQRVQYSFTHKPRWQRWFVRKIRKLRTTPLVYDMKDVNMHIPDYKFDKEENTIPFLLPQWDHTPRSGVRGYLVKSKPELFQQQAENVLKMVGEKRNKFILLKSWNEWAEGNFMEPDLFNGKGYITALRMAVEKYAK